MPFANPMSDAAVDAAVGALSLYENPSIIDTGCGSGEMLLRAISALPGAHGLGVDLDGHAVAEARRRAGNLSARFEVRDGAKICRSFDLAINVASSHVHGGFPVALDALSNLAPVVLYGEGFWQRRPTHEFLVALGDATEDELAGVGAAVRRVGFEVVHESLADNTDWARYEETLAANAESDASPECLAYARQIHERRALPYGTETLGFGLFVLRRH